jgi:DNA-binding transcriptional ArsR family regulator
MNPFKVVQESDDQANALTKILSNKTAQKILESLENGKKTESVLAKELKLPLSTIHYNMKQLVKAELVKNDEYAYSEKGREIIHYSLTDQHIVIRTRPSLSIALLQQIIPALLIFCLGLFVFEDFFSSINASESFDVAQSEASPMMARTVAEPEADMMKAESHLLSDDESLGASQSTQNTKILLFSFFSALIVVLSIAVTSVLYKFKQNES